MKQKEIVEVKILKGNRKNIKLKDFIKTLKVLKDSVKIEFVDYVFFGNRWYSLKDLMQLEVNKK